MKAKTITQLRKKNPDKYIFVFSLAAPRGIASVYQGILPVENDMDLLDFEKKLRKLLLSVGGDVYLPLRKPPRGMVPLKKKAAAGEEGE